MSLKAVARTLRSASIRHSRRTGPSWHQLVMCLVSAVLFTAGTAVLGSSGSPSGWPARRLDGHDASAKAVRTASTLQSAPPGKDELEVRVGEIQKAIDDLQAQQALLSKQMSKRSVGQAPEARSLTRENSRPQPDCSKGKCSNANANRVFHDTYVLDALSFDTYASVPSWMIAMAVVSCALGFCHLCWSRCIGISETKLRLMDFMGILQLALKMYIAGMWLTFYRYNVWVALAVLVSLHVLYSLGSLMFAERAQKRVEEEKMDTDMRSGEVVLEPIKVVNMYQNISTSFAVVVSIFVLQFGLTFMYLQSLCEADLANVKPHFYYGAVLLAIPCQNLMQAAQEVNQGPWAKLRYSVERRHYFREKQSSVWDQLYGQRIKNSSKEERLQSMTQVGQCELTLRLLMSGVSNIALPAVLTSTLPLFLSLAPNGLELVKDAVALIFIVTLDDLTGMDVELEREEDPEGREGSGELAPLNTEP